MYNKLKKFVFANFKKGSYDLVSEVIGKEEIYIRNNKMVVLIEDQEVGKRVFDVVKSLKQWDETISSNHVSFKITDFVADEFNIVQIIFANVELSFEDKWNRLSKFQKIREVVSFAHGMQEKGYIIEDSIFNNESCLNLSDFLSFFKSNGTEEPTTNGCLVKYVHYVLSNGVDLEEYYQPIIKDNEIRELNEFPYHMPVIQMCYNYCLNGTIPEDIDLVLYDEQKENYRRDYYHHKVVVSNSDLSNKLTVTESTENYTVYDGRIKIYKEISTEFEEFLTEACNYFFAYVFKDEVEECLVNLVIDFEGNIIGYEYEIETGENASTVLNLSFNSQREILEFVSEIHRYFNDIHRTVYSNFQTDFEIFNKHEFNIETDLACYCYPEKSCKIIKTDNLYKFVSDNSGEINKDITEVFFKLLLAYLEKTYGKISNKHALYEKKEVRYLSPLLAKEFCNFALGQKVNILAALHAFDSFIDNMLTANDILVFDKNFVYNPDKTVPFIFKREIEKKYGMKMEKGLNENLPDGRNLVMLNRRENIYTLKSKIDFINTEIEGKFSSFNEYVKFVEISEIIYSQDLNSNGLYYVAGYITTPFRGKPLTMENLLHFNNKEILKIAGMLMSNFEKYHIASEKILIDIVQDEYGEDEFLFYINKLDENFDVLKNGGDSAKEFIEAFFDSLVSNGYNANAFVDLDLSNLSSYGIQEYLIDLAKKMDTYCEEHMIYYDGSNKMCPVCLKTQHVIEDGFDNHLPKVFEDEYAIHYKISEEYNLKIYKEACVDMAKMEANINRTINKSIKKENSVLQQDCFIPCKKALDSNRKFIGYLYNSVVFGSSDFNDLNDTKCLENLPRIMSLIRLILQVKELINNHLNFIQNPFGNVFLSKSHKKQVQVVNIEFLSEEGKKKNTIKWTCEYIRNIITSDNCIDINTIDWDTEDLDYILNSLRKYAQTLTKYCSIHKSYYSSEYVFCPKCMDTVQMEKLDVKYINSSDISNWEDFGYGGESIIYKYGKKCLAKIFKEDQINYSFKNKVLARILTKTEILEKINQEKHKFKYIIPKKILVDKKSHKILGYIMNKKVIGKPISVLCDKMEVSSLGITRKDTLEILITVGEGIQTLHDKANIFIGDLNGRNILFDKHKNVYFLDFDGMGVDDISPVFCTDGYIDPVSRDTMNITKKDDWYSLAVQAFYYLTLTHPFNGIYKSKVTGNNLDITEKMKQRLSLLGNHGITVPSIAIPWDWMSNDLKNTFLNIFEGDSRQSIVPELKDQYQKLYGGHEFLQLPKEEIIPIGQKFIAKRNTPFYGDIVRIINCFSAISSKGDDYYATILVDETQYDLHFPDCMKIVDILLLENYATAFAVYPDRIIGFNIRADKEVFCEDFKYDSDNVVVNGNTIYLSKENVIYQFEFDLTQVIKRDRIKFLVNQKTVGFLVKFNSKFILVKRTPDEKDKIYCNSEELCEINSGCISKYNILYDDTTKTWLVISSNGKFIAINSSNGEYTEDKIPVDINDMNVKNIAFNKGIIYIPSQDNLHIINVSNQMTNKKMECHKIMTPDSQLCNFNSHGFSVITDYILYDICIK